MVKADAVNITVSLNEDYAGFGGADLQVVSDTGGTGAVTPSAIANFKMIVYAET